MALLLQLSAAHPPPNKPTHKQLTKMKKNARTTGTVYVLVSLLQHHRKFHTHTHESTHRMGMRTEEGIKFNYLLLIEVMICCRDCPGVGM